MLPCTCFTAPDASRQNQFSLATTKIYEAGSRTTKTTCDASQRTKTPKQLLIPANRQPSMPVTQKKNSVEQITSAPKHIASTSEIGLCHDQGLAGVESLASNPHRQPADSWSTRPCACKKTTHHATAVASHDPFAVISGNQGISTRRILQQTRTPR